ncbi:MAG: hypothetical protein WC759_03035 [Candidatus Micrarchaeia archaeon]
MALNMYANYQYGQLGIGILGSVICCAPIALVVFIVWAIFYKLTAGSLKKDKESKGNYQ